MITIGDCLSYLLGLNKTDLEERKYGLNIKKIIKLRTTILLVNTDRFIIKFKETSDLLELFCVTNFFLKEFNNTIKYLFLVKIDDNLNNDLDLKTFKRKIRIDLKECLRRENTCEIKFDVFLDILNETSSEDFYDSGRDFRGELIGIEFRLEKEKIDFFKDEISLVQVIWDKIRKEKIKLEKDV